MNRILKVLQTSEVPNGQNSDHVLECWQVIMTSDVIIITPLTRETAAILPVVFLPVSSLKPLRTRAASCLHLQHLPS